MSLEGLGVVAKESVDKSKQLHDSLVLSEIFVTLQQEHVVTTITPWPERERERRGREVFFFEKFTIK